MPHIADQIEDKAKIDGTYAVAYAILELARAQKATASAISNLDIAHIAERLDVGAEMIAEAIARAED